MNEHWPSEEDLRLGWRISWLRQEFGRNPSLKRRRALERELDALMQEEHAERA